MSNTRIYIAMAVAGFVIGVACSDSDPKTKKEDAKKIASSALPVPQMGPAMTKSTPPYAAKRANHKKARRRVENSDLKKARALLACKNDPKAHWIKDDYFTYYDCPPYGSIDLETDHDDQAPVFVYAPKAVCTKVLGLVKSYRFLGCNQFAQGLDSYEQILINEKYSGGESRAEHLLACRNDPRAPHALGLMAFPSNGPTDFYDCGEDVGFWEKFGDVQYVHIAGQPVDAPPCSELGQLTDLVERANCFPFSEDEYDAYRKAMQSQSLQMK